MLRAAGNANLDELDWWQSREIAPGVKITAVPVQHFSNRGLTDRNRTLWTGFVVSGPLEQRVLRRGHRLQTRTSRPSPRHSARSGSRSCRLEPTSPSGSWDRFTRRPRRRSRPNACSERRLRLPSTSGHFRWPTMARTSRWRALRKALAAQPRPALLECWDLERDAKSRSPTLTNENRSPVCSLEVGAQSRHGQTARCVQDEKSGSKQVSGCRRPAVRAGRQGPGPQPGVLADGEQVQVDARD